MLRYISLNDYEENGIRYHEFCYDGDIYLEDDQGCVDYVTSCSNCPGEFCDAIPFQSDLLTATCETQSE